MESHKTINMDSDSEDKFGDLGLREDDHYSEIGSYPVPSGLLVSQRGNMPIAPMMTPRSSSNDDCENFFTQQDDCELVIKQHDDAYDD